jgi:hypothetical protein
MSLASTIPLQRNATAPAPELWSQHLQSLIRPDWRPGEFDFRTLVFSRTYRTLELTSGCVGALGAL